MRGVNDLEMDAKELAGVLKTALGKLFMVNLMYQKRSIMKALHITNLLFLISFYLIAEEVPEFRAIPPGFDANAVELTYSTFINGDLSFF